MDLIWILLAGLLLILAITAAFLFLVVIPGGGFNGGLKKRFRSVVYTQRFGSEEPKSEAFNNILKFADSKKGPVSNRSEITLEKKLKFAQWKMTPSMFWGMIVLISIVSCTVCAAFLSMVVVVAAIGVGPVTMNIALDMAMNRRFKAFDQDYPQFLLSLVGLLKTGMNTLTALQASITGLEESSLVRSEVALMLERMRFGVHEERSIGSFGEDINHPEIELFVQALLLSKRVGGNLSDTLDRLARQVRRRQYFREAANAAVGLQRGSIYFIIVILIAMLVYLSFAFPESIQGSLNDEFGWLVWQVAFLMIVVGILWVRQVTKIRI